MSKNRSRSILKQTPVNQSKRNISALIGVSIILSGVVLGFMYVNPRCRVKAVIVSTKTRTSAAGTEEAVKLRLSNGIEEEFAPVSSYVFSRVSYNKNRPNLIFKIRGHNIPGFSYRQIVDVED